MTDEKPEFKLISHSDKVKFNEIVTAWLRTGFVLKNTYSVVTPKSVVHYAALIKDGVEK